MVPQSVSHGPAATLMGPLCRDAQSQRYACADSLVGEKPESLDGDGKEPGAAVRSPGGEEQHSVDLISM